MPGYMGTYIKTQHGVRRLHAKELAMGLGITRESSLKCLQSIIAVSTSLYYWEYISQSLITFGVTIEFLNRPKRIKQSEQMRIDKTSTPFEWTMPDIAVGGKWY